MTVTHRNGSAPRQKAHLIDHTATWDRSLIPGNGGLFNVVPAPNKSTSNNSASTFPAYLAKASRGQRRIHRWLLGRGSVPASDASARRRAGWASALLAAARTVASSELFIANKAAHKSHSGSHGEPQQHRTQTERSSPKPIANPNLSPIKLNQSLYRTLKLSR